MESLYTIFDEMRLANKSNLDETDWLTIREIAEFKNLSVADLLKELGRPEKDGLQGTEKTND